jgi:formylglycine-generating enzyme
MQCPRCRASMPDKATFCGMCGHRLRAPEPLPVTESTSMEETTGSRTDTTPIDPESPLPTKAPEQEEPSGKAEDEDQKPDGSIRRMIEISAGWFAMGARQGEGNQDERPRHQVQLSAYYIDACAVSNVEYEQFDPHHRRLRPEVADGDSDPVVFVTYEDSMEYCRWRCEKEGVPLGTYSLPTEAQWERAARGGQTDVTYPWGDEMDPQACNSLECKRGRTLPVAEGTPKGFGLRYIGSNVREWCKDWYSETYYQTKQACGPDPTGPQPQMAVNVRVVRGASYQDAAEELGRCTARNYAHPTTSSSDIGFRCVRLAP